MNIPVLTPLAAIGDLNWQMAMLCLISLAVTVIAVIKCWITLKIYNLFKQLELTEHYSICKLMSAGNIWDILVQACSARSWHTIHVCSHPHEAFNVGHLSWIHSMIHSWVTNRLTSFGSMIHCSNSETASCEYDSTYNAVFGAMHVQEVYVWYYIF